jgi:hypothetical protein
MWSIFLLGVIVLFGAFGYLVLALFNRDYRRAYEPALGRRVP